jgi:hypothetical protein
MAVREAGLQDVELVHVQVVGAVDPVEGAQVGVPSVLLAMLYWKMGVGAVDDPLVTPVITAMGLAGLVV